MSIVIQSEAPPLRLDEGGAIRVGASRVLLDVVIHEHRRGTPPESIAEAYPAASLADIYAAIAYYLRHPDEVDAYLRERAKMAEEVRAKIEAAQGDLGELGERIRTARKARRGRA